jgi:mannose-6-phosphate isomerase
VRKLTTRSVEKPWGRTELPAPFGRSDGARIGEVWFEDAEPQPLLLKYIFTSERLSIQVHPDDAQARAEGYPHGKEECWYVLDAEPGATIGIGTTRALTGAELRAAALDGSLEHLVDWKPVRAGDFFHIPTGTVHAIGAGITLAEIQQNVDLTYRLYDYGRPRELHLESGVAASRAEPYALPAFNLTPGVVSALPVPDNAPFRVAMIRWDAGDQIALNSGWFLPLAGSGQGWAAGDCVRGDSVVADAPGHGLLAHWVG